MSIFLTDIQAWLRTQAHVIRGRVFPFGDFSCVPLAPEKPETDDAPVGFLLSKGNEVTLVTPQADGNNSSLWDHLLAEMAHWHAYPTRNEILPPECWYG